MTRARAAVLVVAALMLIPVGWLVGRLPGIGFEIVKEEILNDTTGHLVLRSLGLATLVSLASALLSLPLSWLVTRTDVPFRRMWMVLFGLPLAVPSYVGATAFVLCFGVGGLWPGLIESLGLDPRTDVYGFWPAAIVLTLISFPFTFLALVAAWRSLEGDHVEMARSLGCPPGQAFLRITLPKLMPALVSGSLLVFLYVLSDFGSVAALQCETFTWVIYQQYENAWDDTVPTLHSLLLVLLTIGVLSLLGLSRRRGRLSGGARPPERTALGAWTGPALGLSACVVGATLVWPVAVLLNWSGGDFRAALPEGALGTSVALSLAVALTGVAIAWPLARLAARERVRLLDAVVHLAYAMPGIVLGFAFVRLFSRQFPDIYSNHGLAVLVAALLLRFLPEAYGPLRSSAGLLDPVYEEAARVHGQRPFGVWRRVVLPLMGPGALAGGALVFITILKELPVTLILQPRDFSTLALEVWAHVEEAEFSEAALPALVLVSLAILPMTWVSLRRSAEAR